MQLQGNHWRQIAMRELPRQHRGASRSRAEQVLSLQGRLVRPEGNRAKLCRHRRNSAICLTKRSQGRILRSLRQRHNVRRPRSVRLSPSVRRRRSGVNPQPVRNRNAPATNSTAAPALDRAGDALLSEKTHYGIPGPAGNPRGVSPVQKEENPPNRCKHSIISADSGFESLTSPRMHGRGRLWDRVQHLTFFGE